MPKIIKSFTYLLSSILTFLFFLVLITENTKVVSNLYKEKIVQYIEDESQLRFNFDSLNIKWNGLNPNLIFNNISLYMLDEETLYLDGNKLIINIDIINSVSNFKFKISGLNLVESEILLIYDENGLFLRGHNLLNDQKINKDYGFADVGNIKFRISDSSISIKHKKDNVVYDMKNINLVLFSDNNNIKLFTTFNHHDNNEIIHLASDFTLDDNNKINGKIYSQGLNFNPNETLLFSNKIKVLSSDLNYTLWADIKSNRISKLYGSLNIKDILLKNLITNNKISLKNLETDMIYQSSNNVNNILFSNLNLLTDYADYKDNTIHATFNGLYLDNVAIDRLYLKDIKNIINFAPVFGNKTTNSILRDIRDGYLDNLLILDLNNNEKLRYSINFQDIGFMHNNKLSMNNISGNLAGSAKSGKLLIDGKSVEASINSIDKFQLSTLKGLIFYNISNDAISLSSEQFQLGNSHSADIYGTFSDRYSKYKINIQGSLDGLMEIIPEKYTKFIELKNISFDSQYHLDYRIFRDKDKMNSFGAVDFNNLIINDQQYNTSINSKKLRINFFNGYIQSYKTNYYIDNNKYSLLLDTDISGNKTEYNIHSQGILESDLIKKYSNDNLSKSFNGSSPINFKITYQPRDKHIYLKLNSDMKGMAFDIISPLNKKADESRNLEISYILNDKSKKYIKIFFDKYKMRVSNQKHYLTVSINSPSIDGLITLPDIITSDNRLVMRLNYFNLNEFSGKSDPLSYPFLDLSVKKAKINNYYFNNLYLVTSPGKEGMIIERFDFKNTDLSMKGNGKWIQKTKNQITFFDAEFKSNNFGSSLEYMGYPNLIKGGNLSSRMIGQWQGSPDTFSFNNFDGNITIDLKNGEFLQVTKQTRAIGQLLGLFSISSLKKRLSLDFSDFFSSGLSFDIMNGEFNFSKSKAKAKDLLLKGSFGEMRVNGVSDISTRSHNQRLIYIPDLSSMSLISGTLLGGPIGALASIFYDKLLSEMDINTNQLAAVEYSIRGPWDDPEIKVTEPFKPVEN